MVSFVGKELDCEELLSSLINANLQINRQVNSMHGNVSEDLIQEYKIQLEDFCNRHKMDYKKIAQLTNTEHWWGE